MLSCQNLVRLRIKTLHVQARAGVVAVAGAKLAKTEDGRDDIGRYEQSQLAGEAEWCRGRLELRYYPELETLGVRGSAESWDSERWWAGADFGLRADRTLRLELELPEWDRGLSCALVEEWWTEPFFVASPSDVPERTQFLLWRDRDGLYGAMVPLVGGSLSARLAANGHTLELVASSGEEGRLRAEGPLLFAAIGSDPHALVARLYQQAMQFVGRSGRLRREKRYPECLEHLGWCTWDAFYRDVTADQVEAQLTHFNELRLPVGFLLIDDGWYPMQGQMLVSTATDRSKFPDDLGPLFDRARESHGVRYVGVWHALTGYWSGIHPEHQLQGVERDNLQSSRGGRLTPAQDPGGSFAFFSSWHQAIARQRADFVKVDGQGAIHRYSRDVVPLPEAAGNVQRALQASVGAHFQGQMINCMSMTQDLVWFWSMSNVTRSSPDYMINGVEANPARHARANAYNSLWLGQLSWCDWDMFRTDQPSAAFQAALRALSGGPVYVSDGLRVTKPAEIWPLIASDGRVLRCDDVGTPTPDWLLEDPCATPRAFKIRNRAAHAHVIGVFNLCGGGVTVPGRVTRADVGLESDAEVVVWSHRQRAGRRLPTSAALELELGPLGHDVITLVQPTLGFVPVGIVGKLIAPKTVCRFEHGRQQSFIELLEPGELVVYSEKWPARVTVAGQSIPFDWSDNWLRIKVSAGSSLRVELEWE